MANGAVAIASILHNPVIVSSRYYVSNFLNPLLQRQSANTWQECSEERSEVMGTAR
jgi:hypothetical protein